MAPIIIGKTFFAQKLYEKDNGKEKSWTLITYNDKGEIIGEDFVDEKYIAQNYATVLLGEGLMDAKSNLTIATKNDRGETLNVRNVLSKF